MYLPRKGKQSRFYGGREGEQETWEGAGKMGTGGSGKEGEGRWD